MIHFINGHRWNHQGADNKINGKKVSEWSYAMDMHRHLIVPTFDDAFNLKSPNSWVIGEESIALEFHLNSFHADVSGYEVLVIQDDLRSYIVAEKFMRLMKKTFPNRRGRGIKVLTENDRGYNNLLRLKKVYNRAILTEMFFLSNEDDWMDRDIAADFINEFDRTLVREAYKQ